MITSHLKVLLYITVHTDCLRPSGGASILVKSSFQQRKIDLQTELHATAVFDSLDREIRPNLKKYASYNKKRTHLSSVYKKLFFKKL